MYGVIEFAGHGISKGGFDNGNKINEPLFRISSLAIHLDTERKYVINKETHLPAMCCEAKDKKVNVYLSL